MDETAVREAICLAGRMLHARNLVAATDGNISARLPDGTFLCTPSGVSKALMQPHDLIVADGAGERVAGEGKVTSEFHTHLAAYEERPDMAAVVHAHPPFAVAFTLARRTLEEYQLPEVVYTLGAIPTAPYATPGTREGAEALRPWIRRADAVLLAQHGAVTVGTTVLDAYLKMEKLEHACETLHHALALGSVPPLADGQVTKLKQLRRDYGVSGRGYFPDEEAPQRPDSDEYGNP